VQCEKNTEKQSLNTKWRWKNRRPKITGDKCAVKTLVRSKGRAQAYRQRVQPRLVEIPASRTATALGVTWAYASVVAKSNGFRVRVIE